jgi:HSP20 family molecular chaperone IbpA
MFGKRCIGCNGKVRKDHSFCPHCGINMKKLDRFEDFGMFGKDDEISQPQLPLGFNKLFNSLIKELDKQFKDIEKHNYSQMENSIKQKKANNKKDIRTSGISISISTSNSKKPEIRIKSFGPNRQKLVQQKNHDFLNKPFSEQKAKDFSKNKKIEPETNVRRLSDKIIYEIFLPGVSSLNEISIQQLENSIEIKAISKEKSYNKLLTVNYPIDSYYFKNDKLVLELDSSQD